MKTLEVNIKNPIDFKSIDDAIRQICQAKNYDYLILDVGKHDFESIQSIKYLKEELLKLNINDLCFSKVALVHPNEFPHQKSGSSEYEYFTSKSDAQKWLIL